MILTLALTAVGTAQHLASALVSGLEPLRRELDRRDREDKAKRRLIDTTHQDLERL
jgi:hypothetical protein